MKAAYFLFFFLVSCLANAQNVSWVNQVSGTLDGRGNDLVVDAAGNVYSTGTFTGEIDLDPGPGTFNFTQTSGAGAYILKQDANGNFLWARQLQSENIVSYEIALDATGNIYTSGFYQFTADFDPGPGVYRLSIPNNQGSHGFICKLDNDGNFIWAKEIGGNNNSYLSIYDLQIDRSDNIILTGLFNGNSDFDPGPGELRLTAAGLDDSYVIKLDNNGDLLWVRQFSGLKYEGGQSVSIDPAGNVYSTGTFQGTIDFDPGPATYNLSAPSGSIYISKLDGNGNFVWAKQIEGASQKFPNSIVVDAAQNVFVTGYFRTDTDFDPGPSVFNMAAMGGVDIFLLKLNGAGEFSWAKQIGGSGDDEGKMLSIDLSGNLYLTGYFQSAVDLDPGPFSVNFTSAGSYDAFISKFDNDGALLWAKPMGGVASDMGLSTTTDVSGNVYVTGRFSETVNFDPQSTSFILTSGGVDDAFVLKLGKCKNITNTTLNITTCNSYTLNGQVYTTSGIYTQTLLNTFNCDSIITLHLDIGGSLFNTSETACESYFWEGQLYTSSGVYTKTFIDVKGCDSVRKLNLTIEKKKNETITVSICEGQSFEDYSISGTYTDHFIAKNGCDSIRILELTVRPKTFSTIKAVICEGQSYEGYTIAGTYNDIFIGSNGCDSIRTIELLVNPHKTTNLQVAICEGQTYIVGGASQSISGTYRDTLKSITGCDSIIVTVLTVNPKPKPNLGQDLTLCEGASIVFTPGTFASYTWQDKSNHSSFTAKTTGVFWVEVLNVLNCSATDSVRVQAINPLPKAFLKDEDSICSYERLVLKPVRNFNSYEWSTGAIQNNITVGVPGLYWLKVSDQYGCIGMDTIIIKPKKCISGIFIPTAFTPNNDGKNDFFKALVYGNVTAFKLQVYDRWGQLVFHTADPNLGWDGLNKGKSYTTTLFVWQCSYQLEGEQPAFQKGTVTLLR